MSDVLLVAALLVGITAMWVWALTSARRDRRTEHEFEDMAACWEWPPEDYH